ncbi:hypothetical protein F4777DRAFT_579261 [Nemania sp. FL0916]|nr:hypothetical protein F4777DRAFT_579261 [Nemania sp. FL0916]
MSPSRKPTDPLYTKEMLYQIEASLATGDDRTVDLMNVGGEIVQEELEECDTTPRDMEGWGLVSDQYIVGFLNEQYGGFRETEDFVSIWAPTNLYFEPNKTEQETQELFTTVLKEYEASEEAAALTDLIKSQLKDTAVNKVMGFGLGSPGFTQPALFEIWLKVKDKSNFALSNFVDYAAALVVARAVAEMNGSDVVPPVLVQDPAYTPVCKQVLTASGFEIIECFAGKGFTLVDENTIVLSHNPDFPFRGIIADLARPAAICMRHQHGPDESNDTADPDNPRSKKMLEMYREVTLPFEEQRAFYHNVWYIREPKKE